MSYDETDYRYEEYMEELYEEHKGVAVEECRVARLQSYYASNPSLALPSLRYLADGRELLAVSPSAALLFAAIAAEHAWKRVLLHPIVHGLVHDEATAALVAGLVVSQMGIDRFKELLFAILDSVGRIDLRKHRRTGAKEPLWKELNDLQRQRNALLHRAAAVTEPEALHAIAVAEELLERIFPSVIHSLAMHVHSDGNVCADRRCIDRHELKKTAKAEGWDLHQLGLT